MIRVALQIQPAIEVYNDDGDLIGSPEIRNVRIAAGSREALGRALAQLDAQLAPLFDQGQEGQSEASSSGQEA